jgi:hypothetical protein
MCIEQLASQISGGPERAMQKSVSIVLLLLFFLTMAEASNGMTPPHYTCKQQDQPANCLNNPAIHIEMYSTGDTCTYQLTFNFKCYAICDFCKRSLLQDSGIIHAMPCGYRIIIHKNHNVMQFNIIHDVISYLQENVMKMSKLNVNKTWIRFLKPSVKASHSILAI